MKPEQMYEGLRDIPEYKVGQRVEIQEVGHPYWMPLEGGWQRGDLRPELVGARGTIIEVKQANEAFDVVKDVGIDFDDYGKIYWFNNYQIKVLEDERTEGSDSGGDNNSS